jgi:hypothetical protein
MIRSSAVRTQFQSCSVRSMKFGDIWKRAGMSAFFLGMYTQAGKRLQLSYASVWMSCSLIPRF